MSHDGIMIGYARVSTDDQDLQAQREALQRLGVDEDRIYFDHGRSGKNRERPGLAQALAACRQGDIFVVTKLDRLARSGRDADDIAKDLQARGICVSLAGRVHDPTDPMDKLFWDMLAAFAEFEGNLISARTREGMAVARSRGRLKGRQPKLTAAQQKQVMRLMDEGEHTPAEIGAMFGVSRQTVYRTVAAAKGAAA